MLMHLLGLWLLNTVRKAGKRLLSGIRYRLTMGGKAGYPVQGNLAKRLRVEGNYLSLDAIANLAVQSLNSDDDLFFDIAVSTHDAGVQTVRLFRSNNNSSLLLEVLPINEIKGVYTKNLSKESLLAELTRLTSIDNRSWFDLHDYRYTPW
jgi:hypothetical protein